MEESTKQNGKNKQADSCRYIKKRQGDLHFRKVKNSTIILRLKFISHCSGDEAGLLQERTPASPTQSEGIPFQSAI